MTAPSRSRPDEQKRRVQGKLLSSEDYLASCFEPIPVEVRYTNNVSQVLSFRARPDKIVFRLHHIFEDAPPRVLDAVRDFAHRKVTARRRKNAQAIINGFVEDNADRIGRSGKRRLRPIVAKGEHWDLEDVFKDVNKKFFGGRLKYRVGWSPRCNKVTMGTWTHAEDGGPNIIRVNKLLDQFDVPGFYLSYLAYHELLHEYIGARESGGRCRYHPAGFSEMERRHPDYERAKRWAEESLPRLWRRHRRRRSRSRKS